MDFFGTQCIRNGSRTYQTGLSCCRCINNPEPTWDSRSSFFFAQPPRYLLGACSDRGLLALLLSLSVVLNVNKQLCSVADWLNCAGDGSGGVVDFGVAPICRNARRTLRKAAESQPISHECVPPVPQEQTAGARRNICRRGPAPEYPPAR